MQLAFARDQSLTDSSEMLENGFMIIAFPADIVGDLQLHIADFIGASSKIGAGDITQAAMSLSDEDFVQRFRKPFRMFPDELTSRIVAWVEGQAARLGGARAGVNYVVEDEFRANPKLTPHSFDIFWRCVRPGKGDVGAPHCDYQFWEIARGTSLEPRVPFEYDERWKIWFPISGCEKGNAIEVIPGSHNREIPVAYKPTPNGLKPSIAQGWLADHEDEFICPFDEFPGNCVLFHDKLVHRGPPNRFADLRISGEFTVLLRR